MARRFTIARWMRLVVLAALVFAVARRFEGDWWVMAVLDVLNLVLWTSLVGFVLMVLLGTGPFAVIRRLRSPSGPDS